MANIGHVSTHYIPVRGGQEVYVDNLIRALSSHNHTVFQLSQPGMDAEPCTIAAIRKIKKHRRMPAVMDMALGLTLQHRSLMKMDVLIVNYPEYFRPVSWHRRVIVLSHGATWGNLSGGFRETKKRMSRQALDGCAAYVFNDTFAMREIGIDVTASTHCFQWVTPRAIFIPNCVDTQRFTPTKGKSSIRALKFICVPRNLNPGRGIDLSIRALAEVVRNNFDLNLLIVGDSNIGDVAYRSELFRLTNMLGLVGRVFFLGSVANENMPDVYSSCVMTLIPTRYREGTSLSALESMACGTPVVATGVEGLLDLPVHHCEVTAESIAEAIMWMAKRRDQEAESQRRNVVESFSIERWRTAWNGVLDRVLTTGSARGQH